jgi:hypothetical protein
MIKLTMLSLAVLAFAMATTTTPAFAGLDSTNGTSLDGIAEKSAANELNGVDVAVVGEQMTSTSRLDPQPELPGWVPQPEPPDGHNAYPPGPY